MTAHTFRRIASIGLAGALLAGLGGGVAATGASAGSGGSDDDDDRRISLTSRAGRRACAVARRRVDGGTCTKVVRKTGEDDGTRYEVGVRRRALRYEVDLSARFRVLDVSRDDDSGRDDDGRDDDRRDD